MGDDEPHTPVTSAGTRFSRRINHPIDARILSSLAVSISDQQHDAVDRRRQILERPNEIWARSRKILARPRVG